MIRRKHLVALIKHIINGEAWSWKGTFSPETGLVDLSGRTWSPPKFPKFCPVRFSHNNRRRCPALSGRHGVLLIRTINYLLSNLSLFLSNKIPFKIISYPKKSVVHLAYLRHHISKTQRWAHLTYWARYSGPRIGSGGRRRWATVQPSFHLRSPARQTMSISIEEIDIK